MDINLSCTAMSYSMIILKLHECIAVKNRDWGLQEAGVNFKGGVLKVKSPAAKDKTRGK